MHASTSPSPRIVSTKYFRSRNISSRSVTVGPWNRKRNEDMVSCVQVRTHVKRQINESVATNLRHNFPPFLIENIVNVFHHHVLRQFILADVLHNLFWFTPSKLQVAHCLPSFRPHNPASWESCQILAEWVVVPGVLHRQNPFIKFPLPLCRKWAPSFRRRRDPVFASGALPVLFLLRQS